MWYIHIQYLCTTFFGVTKFSNVFNWIVPNLYIYILHGKYKQINWYWSRPNFIFKGHPNTCF